MSLNLPEGGGGNYVPYIKYNAKSGRMSYRPEGSKDDVELRTPVKLAFDFQSIQTGWISFSVNGGPPTKRWDPSLKTEALSPEPGNDKCKRGFRLLVSVGLKGVGLRELMSTAGVVLEPIKALYETWEQHGNREEIPVVVFDGAEAVKGVHGTNYKPIFSIEKYVPRENVPGFDVAPTPTGPVGNEPSAGGVDPFSSKADPESHQEDDDRIPF